MVWESDAKRFGRGATLGNDPVELGLVDEHPSRLGALVAGDDAAPFEHVDEPAGTRVADPQAALEERRRGGLGLDDDLDRAVEERVFVGVELLVRIRVLGWRLGGLEERWIEFLLPLCAALLDDQRDLLLADVGTLDALQPRGAERLEEHVALAEEALGAALVDDHARVGLA